MIPSALPARKSMSVRSIRYWPAGMCRTHKYLTESGFVTRRHAHGLRVHVFDSSVQSHMETVKQFNSRTFLSAPWRCLVHSKTDVHTFT